MKKSVISSVIGILVAGTVLLSGCSKKESASVEESSKTQKSTVSISFLNSKGEIQEALENVAQQYTKQTGIKVDIVACGAGEVPYTKITTMYNSGNPPTFSMLDTLDVVSLAKEYAVDLSSEKWIQETNQLTKIDGKVYSFPFCVEGRGIIYNKSAIEKTLGHSFDANSINSYSTFKALLEELASKGMKYPVFLAKEDWSLGSHQLGFIYDTYDGTTAGSEKIINDLKNGLDPASYNRYNAFMDTLDLLIKYNIAHEDPLGADYDEGALRLATGEVAFWANGNWAWPNIKEGGASESESFAFLPFVLGNDTGDFANNQMQASATKQVIIDKVHASAEQQQAAKDFLNWLVFDDAGQKALVQTCALIPACTNNAYSPSDPLGKDIVAKMAAGKTFSSSYIAPSDHWSAMGERLQKYVSGNSDRATFTKELSDYWTSQK